MWPFLLLAGVGWLLLQKSPPDVYAQALGAYEGFFAWDSWEHEGPVPDQPIVVFQLGKVAAPPTADGQTQIRAIAFFRWAHDAGFDIWALNDDPSYIYLSSVHVEPSQDITGGQLVHSVLLAMTPWPQGVG